MTSIDQSALLSYSASQLFELVNDIESYPQFMDGCLSAEIISSKPQEVTARLELGKAGLHYTFTTCNTLNSPESMTMALVEGPFSYFDATWYFKELNESACKINLKMEFEFSSGLIDMSLRYLFENTSRNLVNAICRRAEEFYG